MKKIIKSIIFLMLLVTSLQAQIVLHSTRPFNQQDTYPAQRFWDDGTNVHFQTSDKQDYSLYQIYDWNLGTGMQTPLAGAACCYAVWVDQNSNGISGWGNNWMAAYQWTITNNTLRTYLSPSGIDAANCRILSVKRFNGVLTALLADIGSLKTGCVTQLHLVTGDGFTPLVTKNILLPCGMSTWIGNLNGSITRHPNGQLWMLTMRDSNHDMDLTINDNGNISTYANWQRTQGELPMQLCEPFFTNGVAILSCDTASVSTSWPWYRSLPYIIIAKSPTSYEKFYVPNVDMERQQAMQMTLDSSGNPIIQLLLRDPTKPPYTDATAVHRENDTWATAWRFKNSSFELLDSRIITNGSGDVRLGGIFAVRGKIYIAYLSSDNGTDIKILNDSIVPPLNLPVANFTATPTNGVVPLNVTFTDTSTGQAGLSHWDFGNGTLDTNALSFVRIYTAGTYNVSLIVTNAGVASTNTKPAYITVLPTVITNTCPPCPVVTNCLPVVVSPCYCTNTSINIVETVNNRGKVISITTNTNYTVTLCK
jgi:hypothetical protein